MRWLLLKDLQILKRSPLVVALLVVYPIALGVLIGFALSGDDSKPKVAFLNEAPTQRPRSSTSASATTRSAAPTPGASSASGSSASTSTPARRPSRWSRTATSSAP